MTASTSTYSTQALGCAEGLLQRVVQLDGTLTTYLGLEIGTGGRSRRVMDVERLADYRHSSEA